MAMEESIIRIPPYHYIHVLDQNSNVSRVEVGPKTYIRQDNERILFTPVRMVTVPPRHYCMVANPVARDAQGTVLFDITGQVRLRHADLEIRLAQDPFPLFPGEVLEKDITPLQVVLPNTALHLKALLDFEDKNGQKVVAGDEWLFEGPGTYIPQKEVEVIEIIQATVIKQNQALRLRARKECLDRDGKERVTGEEWLVRSVGAYLPAVFEEVLDVVDAVILTEKTALHLRARQNFRDVRGVSRRTGEEWLVTVQDTEAHVPDVYEEVMGVVSVTTLGPHNYCVILDPVGPDGKNQLGQKLVFKGEQSFFLQPGEKLERGIQNVYVLSEQQGLLLRALQPLEEGEGKEKVSHQAGDRWLIRGPLEYVPPAKVEVVEERQAIPLDENEGIYVQDVKTGRVRAVIGSTYMLTHLAYDEAIMAQQDRIQQEIAVQNPLVSERLELSVLYKEYAEDDNIYQQKIKDLHKKYSYIRKTRPDGNCFYRAFGFSHLEALLDDSKELQRFKAVSAKSKEDLVSQGFTEFTIEDFHNTFMDLIEQVEKRTPVADLLASFNDQSTSDYLVVYLRLLTSGYLQRESKFFEHFIEGGRTVKEFCQQEVEPMCKESDHIHIIALAQALSVSIQVEYMDRGEGGTTNPHVFPEGSEPKVYLLYRPGHYDILYK